MRSVVVCLLPLAFCILVEWDTIMVDLYSHLMPYFGQGSPCPKRTQRKREKDNVVYHRAEHRWISFICSHCFPFLSLFFSLSRACHWGDAYCIHTHTLAHTHTQRLEAQSIVFPLFPIPPSQPFCPFFFLCVWNVPSTVTGC